ncbi:MAG: YkvA family protein [Chloroflexota bacterium]
MRFFREFFIFILGALALIYLFLPSLLPDLVPLVGWLDEGVATTIVLGVLKHYGLDLTSLFADDDKTAMKQSDREITVNLQDSAQPNQPTQKIRIPRAVLEQALRDYEMQQRQQSARR